MDQWEYEVFDLYVYGGVEGYLDKVEALKQHLNKLGEEGWEHTGCWDGSAHYAVFKRKRASENSPPEGR